MENFLSEKATRGNSDQLKGYLPLQFKHVHFR